MLEKLNNSVLQHLWISELVAASEIWVQVADIFAVPCEWTSTAPSIFLQSLFSP